MFRFEDPLYLYLLLIIPILAVVRYVGWRQRRKKLRKFGDPELLKELMPDVSKYRPTVKFWLLMAALALLIVMLARPQMGTKISHEKRNGIETIICMDISNSMMAEDVVPSRLAKSKMLVENLVDHFTNDKIGLVVFAGDAFTQLPITSDYVSAKMFLQNIEPSLIASQGTDIAQAIRLAMNSFTQQEKIGRQSSSSPMARIMREEPLMRRKRLRRRASMSSSLAWEIPRERLSPQVMEGI